MRIDLTDLDRLDGIAAALARLFWCLVLVAFLAAVLGSAGTSLLVLILAGAAFVVRVGLEDFARAQRRARRPDSAPARAPRPRSAAGRRRGSAPTPRPS